MVSPVRWPTERDNGGPAILTNGPPNVTAYIRTHNTGLVQTLPGATGLGVGGDDAAGRACLTLDAFWRLLHVFLLDVYAERFQTGLGGIPARRWAQGLAAGVVPSLLGRATLRTVRRGRRGRHGWRHNQYQDASRSGVRVRGAVVSCGRGGLARPLGRS